MSDTTKYNPDDSNTWARVEIDLNVRTRRYQYHDETFTGFESISGHMPKLGENVIAYESESTMTGCGWITGWDPHKELVYLQVDWCCMYPEDPDA